MKRVVIWAMLLGLAIVPVYSTSATAQQAVAAQQTSAKAAEVREVYPRDLMTMRERFDMWRAMRAAKTSEEKMGLWAAKWGELEKRAAERGLKLVEMGPMVMQKYGSSKEGNQGSGSEKRMSMMRDGGGWSGMRPHPPAGR